MTTPTFQQLSNPANGGPGFNPESYPQRLLTILSMISSGQNPDGTSLPVGSGNYLSLTGPGKTTTPGSLTQAGGFTITDLAGAGFTVSSSGAGGTGITFTDNSPSNGFNIFEQGGGGILIQQTGSGGSIALSLNNGNAATQIGISTNAGSVVISGHGGVQIGSATASINIAANGGAVTVSNTGDKLGFYGTTGSGVTKPTVSGSKSANAALTSLMTALSSLGLVTDSTT